MQRPIQTLVLAFVGLAVTALSATFLQGTEDRAAKRYRAVERLGDRVKTADPNHVDPKLEGQLIRLEGMATPESEVVDPDLGVRTSGLLLARSVEMWQWHETERGGETVYEQGWSDALVDSDAFAEPEGHRNPDAPRLLPLTVTGTVKVGEFVMPDLQVRSIQKRVPVPVTSVDSLPDEFQPASVRDDALFLGNDPDSPQVGDLRVRFETIEPLEVRLLGIQQGNSLTHFGNDKNPRFLVLKIEDQQLFPNLDSITPGQIWLHRSLAFAGLLLGLGLLRQALVERLRPGLGAVSALALAAGFGTAVAPWLEVSGLHAWSLFGVAVACATAALVLIRRS